MEGWVSKEHLLQAGRRWLFSTRKEDWHSKVWLVFHVLRRAEKMGCTESAWLLRRFGSVDLYTFDNKYMWIDAIMYNDESSRSDYYRGRAKRLLGSNALKLLRRSAERGFAPAMIEMSNFGPPQDCDFWLRCAAERNDPTALFKLGKLREAAEKGHILSYKILSEDPLLSPVEAARLRARYVLLSMDKDYLPPSVPRDPEVYFATGYELDNYELFCGVYFQPKRYYRRCIRFYRDRAFRTLLLAIFGLRKHLGRDVANLIGRMAYDAIF